MFRRKMSNCQVWLYHIAYAHTDKICKLEGTPSKCLSLPNEKGPGYNYFTSYSFLQVRDIAPAQACLPACTDLLGICH